MKRILFTICLLMITIVAITAQVGEIVFEPQALELIKKSAGEARILTSVPPEGIKKQAAIFQSWAASFINLEKAEKRESRVFNRISYIQDLPLNLPFYLGEEFKPSAKPQQLSSPLRTLFRQGLLSLSLAKLKEEKTTKVMDEKEFFELGKKFLVANNFLSQSREDQISEFEVLTANFSMEGEKEGMEDQVLTGQQDLLLYRAYNGRPVFNSSALLGVLPETGEVVELSLTDWTPVDAYRRLELTAAELRKLGIYDVNQILEKIKKLITEGCGPAEKAVVTGVIPGYYQTSEWLYPVLGIELVVEYRGEKEPVTEEYFEAINLGGEDGIFTKDYRQVPVASPPKE